MMYLDQYPHFFLTEILMKYTDSKYHTQVLQLVGDYCGKPVTNFTEDPFQPPLTWSFYHAFFFSFTVCSTVGMGSHLSHSNFLK